MTLIELDRDLAAELQQKIAGAFWLVQDVLTVPIHQFTRQRVVGNLPYNISTPLLARLFEQPCIQDMHFMLQKEVGHRLTATAGTKDWGRLSVMAQYRWQIDPVLDVPATAFRPVPKVDSMFLRFLPIQFRPQVEDIRVFQSVIREAFSQRRKTLTNSLSNYNIRWDEIPVDKKLRADHLSVQDYVVLANSVTRQ